MDLELRGLLRHCVAAGVLMELMMITEGADNGMHLVVINDSE